VNLSADHIQLFFLSPYTSFSVIKISAQKISLPLPTPLPVLANTTVNKKKKDIMWQQNTSLSFEVFPLS